MSSAQVGEGGDRYKTDARHVGSLHSASRSLGERQSHVLTANMGKEKTHINIVVIGHVDSGKFSNLPAAKAGFGNRQTVVCATPSARNVTKLTLRRVFFRVLCV